MILRAAAEVRKGCDAGGGGLTQEGGVGGGEDMKCVAPSKIPHATKSTKVPNSRSYNSELSIKKLTPPPPPPPFKDLKHSLPNDGSRL